MRFGSFISFSAAAVAHTGSDRFRLDLRFLPVGIILNQACSYSRDKCGKGSDNGHDRIQERIGDGD
jgi:hypothetical protein